VRAAFVALAAGLLLAAGAVMAQPLPVLQFEPPKGFTGSLGKNPSAHVSMNGDATLNIYPFRRLNGAFEDQFRKTRLRELVTPDSQEGQLAGPVEVQLLPVPGAEKAFFARFAENRFGSLRYRLRVAVYSGGAVALVDYNAAGADGYQRNWPAVAAVLDSLKVGAAETTAKGNAAQVKPQAAPAGGVDGLYLASTRRFVMRIGGAPGSGDWEIATRFYLLSPNGRFHRGYGLPSVPGGDVRAFDYAKAEREDGANTGTYTFVKGGKLVLRTRTGDAVEGSVSGGELAVDNMTFKKAALK
jgi:hypothetical protein